jgi:hypothetical protein
MTLQVSGVGVQPSLRRLLGTATRTSHIAAPCDGRAPTPDAPSEAEVTGSARPGGSLSGAGYTSASDLPPASRLLRVLYMATTGTVAGWLGAYQGYSRQTLLASLIGMAGGAVVTLPLAGVRVAWRTLRRSMS